MNRQFYLFLILILIVAAERLFLPIGHFYFAAHLSLLYLVVWMVMDGRFEEWLWPALWVVLLSEVVSGLFWGTIALAALIVFSVIKWLRSRIIWPERSWIFSFVASLAGYTLSWLVAVGLAWLKHRRPGETKVLWDGVLSSFYFLWSWREGGLLIFILSVYILIVKRFLRPYTDSRRYLSGY